MTDSMMDSEGVSQSTDAPRNGRVSRAYRPESSRFPRQSTAPPSPDLAILRSAPICVAPFQP